MASRLLWFQTLSFSVNFILEHCSPFSPSFAGEWRGFFLQLSYSDVLPKLFRKELGKFFGRAFQHFSSSLFGGCGHLLYFFWKMTRRVLGSQHPSDPVLAEVNRVAWKFEAYQAFSGSGEAHPVRMALDQWMSINFNKQKSLIRSRWFMMLIRWSAAWNDHCLLLSTRLSRDGNA